MSKTDYTEKVINKNMGLVDFVREFSSVVLTLDTIINKCEMIRPRYYTIASSSLKYPKDLAIAVSLESF